MRFVNVLLLLVVIGEGWFIGQLDKEIKRQTSLADANAGFYSTCAKQKAFPLDPRMAKFHIPKDMLK